MRRREEDGKRPQVSTAGAESSSFGSPHKSARKSISSGTAKVPRLHLPSSPRLEEWEEKERITHQKRKEALENRLMLTQQSQSQPSHASYTAHTEDTTDQKGDSVPSPSPSPRGTQSARSSVHQQATTDPTHYTEGLYVPPLRLISPSTGRALSPRGSYKKENAPVSAWETMTRNRRAQTHRATESSTRTTLAPQRPKERKPKRWAQISMRQERAKTESSAKALIKRAFGQHGLQLSFLKELVKDPKFTVDELMTGGFLKLAKQDNCLYRLRVATPGEASIGESITLSTNGLIFQKKIEDGKGSTDDEFISLTEYELRYSQYHSLLKLPFVQKFRQWRVFHVWKRFSQRIKFTRAKQNLKDASFLLRRPTRQSLLELKRTILDDILTQTLFEVDKTKTYSLYGFIQSQKTVREKLSQNLNAVIENLKFLIRSACDEDLRNFLVSCGFLKTTERFPSSVEETEYRMSFAERAAMRRKCSHLVRFVRLCDCIIIDGLSQLGIKSVSMLQDALDPVWMRKMVSGKQIESKPLFEVIVDGEPSVPALSEDAGSVDDSEDDSEEEHVTDKLIHKDVVEHVDKINSCTYDSVYVSTALQKFIGKSESNKSIMEEYDIDGMTFNPKCDAFKQSIESALYTSISTLSMPSIRLLYSEVFNPFLSSVLLDTDTDEGNQIESRMDVEQLLLETPVFQKTVDNILDDLMLGFQAVEEASKCLQPCRQIAISNLQIVQSIECENLEKVTPDVFTRMVEYHEKEHQALTKIPESLEIGVFKLITSAFKDRVKDLPLQCIHSLVCTVPGLMLRTTDRVLDAYSWYLRKLKSTPNTLEDYVDILETLERAQDEANDWYLEEEYVKSIFQLLQENQKYMKDVATDGRPLLADEDKTKIIMMQKSSAQLGDVMRDVETSQDFQTKKFAKTLDERIPALKSRIMKSRNTSEEETVFDEDSDPHKVTRMLSTVVEEVSGQVEEAKLIQRYQKTLGIPVSSFDSLWELHGDMKMKRSLWQLYQGWQDYWDEIMETRVDEMDVSGMREKFTYFSKQALRYERDREGLPEARVAKACRERVNESKGLIPLLSDLRSEYLKPRHWAKINEAAGMDLEKQKSELKLKDVIDLDLLAVSSTISRVANEAVQEAALQDLLDSVREKWHEFELKMVGFKHARDMSILSDVETTQELLDESFVTVHTISSSRFVEPLRRPVEEFATKLSQLQDVLDEWVQVQQSWMSLYPIFAVSGSDIERQLPNESKAFQTVNHSFKDVCKRTKEDPLALRVGSRPGLRELLQKHNNTLEYVQKGLDSYMDVKRKKFPRLYFLSDDDLLLVLSEAANDPASIQPHLSKVFDNISRLTMESTPEGSSLDITHMISLEHEKVSLGKNLKARSNVPLEEWMSQVEERMKVSLEDNLHKLVNAKGQYQCRIDWIKDTTFPSQIITTCCQIEFTQMVENALNEDALVVVDADQTKKKRSSSKRLLAASSSNNISTADTETSEFSTSLQRCYSKQLEFLSELTQAMKGEMNKIQRQTLVNQLISDVHHRDILETMKDQGVVSPDEFAWKQQIRFYYQGHGTEVGSSCLVCQGNSSIPYGFEFEGATDRLVITPLTDRCWITITAALSFFLGANPQGPAGTGKTESSKDLAKNLGIQCIVFNCSEQIDYNTVGKLFAGLAQAGAWACLDEFNRINIEVLSVVAQQMRELRHARLMGKSEVMFEGRNMDILSHHIIATMNPGYAGRTELPENLQTMFRPVAMMVPDYNRIAEIMLFSAGFQEAKSLSVKLIKMIQLCTEQLSQQSHYDFGLRAVKSVLKVAAELKQSGSDKDESRLLIKSLTDSNAPKMTPDDLQLFRAIIQDMFPNVPTKTSHDELMKSTVRAVLEDTDMSSSNQFVGKIMDLDQILKVRTGVALVGIASGKSVASQALAITRCHLAAYREAQRQKNEAEQEEIESSSSEDSENEEEKPHTKKPVNVPASPRRFDNLPAPVTVIEMNPKSLSIEELYGRYDDLTQEWHDGLLSTLIRRAVKGTNDDKMPEGLGRECWIGIDGPVDSLWIENMNTVLDDSNMMCLASGERIRMNSNIRMLFECGDLLHASPATVSRLGVVYMPHGIVSWRMYGTARAKEFINEKIANHTIMKRVAHILGTFLGPAVGFFVHHCIETADDQFDDSQTLSALATKGDRNGENVDDAGLDANHSSTLNLASSFFSLLKGSLNFLVRQGVDVLNSMSEKSLDRVILWCFTWSVGATLCGEHWKRFDKWIRCFSRHCGITLEFPQQGLVYDYYLRVEDENEVRFRPWKDIVPEFVYDPEIPLPNMLVPTVDTVRFQKVIEFHLFESKSAWDTIGLRYAAKCEEKMQNQKASKLVSVDKARPIPGSSAFTTPAGVRVGMPRKPILLTGPSGCGKSAILRHYLRRHTSAMMEARRSDHFETEDDKDPESKVIEAPTESKKIDLMPLLFSARTSSEDVQSSIERKMNRMRKGLLVPEKKTEGILFIEDMHLPEKETYGAQPPLELVRQIVDFGGMHSRNDFHWQHLQDTMVIATCAPPSGGRSRIPPRLQRHFCLLSMPQPSSEVLVHMFSSLIIGILGEDFHSEVRAMRSSVIRATVQLYHSCKDCLKPSPSKAHYVFNVRDISKVVQGLAMANAHSCPDGGVLARLWMHECSRVFRDRLIDESDRKTFDELIIEYAKNYLKVQWSVDSVFGNQATIQAASERAKQDQQNDQPNYEDRKRFGKGRGRRRSSISIPAVGPLYFGHFLHRGEDIKEYSFCEEPHRIPTLLDDYLQEYNENAPVQLELVFFQDAVDHLLRICRILGQPRGHMLFIGVGGCGKQSLTRLAAFMSGCELSSPTMVGGYHRGHFRDHLKELITDAGVDNKKIAFLLTDMQLTAETFLEDINSLLNNGEVPNLFDTNEMETLVTKVRSKYEALKQTEDGADEEDEVDIYLSWEQAIDKFYEDVHKNLHIVLALSPQSESFSARLRTFPALVNCCTIDWINPWPENALFQVSRKVLSEIRLPVAADEETIESTKDEESLLESLTVDAHRHLKYKALVGSTVSMYRVASRFAREAKSRQKQPVHFTPRTFLDFLYTFVWHLESIFKARRNNMERYSTGIRRLKETESNVNYLQHQLHDLAPKLTEKSKQTEEMLEKVKEEQKHASSKRDIVEGEERDVRKQQQQVEKLKEEAEKDLEVAMPALKNAIESLNSLSKQDISEMRTFSQPPPGVRFVMEAVCALLGEKTDWDSSRKLLSQPDNFIRTLQSYDKENITKSNLSKLQKYTSNPSMSVENVSKVSKAATSICMWLHAVEKYCLVYQEVQPKREKLVEMERELNGANEELRSKQNELNEIVEHVNELEDSCRKTEAEKENLEKEKHNCQRRLESAEKLLACIATEGSRWKSEFQKLVRSQDKIIGEVLMGSAVCVHLAPFDARIRPEIMKEWTDILHRKQLPISDDFSLETTLTTPVKLQEWHAKGLPTDSNSILSAIIASNGYRWPYFLDPNQQAVDWIKAIEGSSMESFNLSHAEEGGTGSFQPTSENDGSNPKARRTVKRTLEQVVEYCVRGGLPLFLEDCPEDLPASLDPILNKEQTIDRGGRTTVKVGDKTVDFDSNFRLYLATREPEVNMVPEQAVKVNIINFNATVASIEEQLLSNVVHNEKPEIEQRKQSLLVELAKNRRELYRLEVQVLEQISEAGENILDKTDVIETLETAQKTSQNINQRLEQSKETTRELDTARDAYRPLSKRGAVLFDVVSSLREINPMYMYSLKYFTKLFVANVRRLSPVAVDKDSQEIHQVTKAVTRRLFSTVQQGLFEQDQLSFALLVALRIDVAEGTVSTDEVHTLLRGSAIGSTTKSRYHNPFRDSASPVSNDQWTSLASLDRLLGTSVTKSASEAPDLWGEWRQTEDLDFETAPNDLHSIGDVSKLVVIKALAPKKLLKGVSWYAAKVLGDSMHDSSSLTTLTESLDSSVPCLFIVSKGADPSSSLQDLASANGMDSTLKFYSLGRGQGSRAEVGIKEAQENGYWVCLQNCHVSPSWLPRLGKLIDTLSSKKVHEDFRLFLTSAPVSNFPAQILQSCVKVTSEPPRGLKANLVQCIDVAKSNWDMQVSGSSESGEEDTQVWGRLDSLQKRLKLQLCLFHALLKERQRYGAIGLNTRYDFSGSDLSTSCSHVNELTQIAYITRTGFQSEKSRSEMFPWDAFYYLVGHINYGGRITDDWDRRCVLTMLSYTCSPDPERNLMKLWGDCISSYPLMPNCVSTVDDLLTYAQKFPDFDTPEVFGLHSSADNVQRSLRSQNLLYTTFGSFKQLDIDVGDKNSSEDAPAGGAVQAIRSKRKDDTESSDTLSDSDRRTLESCVEIQNALPEPIESLRIPQALKLPLAVVLMQEIERFNTLVNLIQRTLNSLHQATLGEAVMSQQLEEVRESIERMRVPYSWRQAAYPSLKPLGAWLEDLSEKVRFFGNWVRHVNKNQGKHDASAPQRRYNLGAFMFPQGFLTALLQLHARKMGTAVDQLSFDFLFDVGPQQSTTSVGKQGGSILSGLWLQGGSWASPESSSTLSTADDDVRLQGVLDEASLESQFCSMPDFAIFPTASKPERNDRYICPLYRTAAREGTLSSMGLSTNFVMSIELPCEGSPEKWVLRGTAMVLEPYVS